MKKNNIGKLSLLLMSAVLSLSVNSALAINQDPISITGLETITPATDEYNFDTQTKYYVDYASELGGGIYNIGTAGQLNLNTGATGSVIFKNIDAVVTRPADVDNAGNPFSSYEISRKGGVIFNIGELFIGCELDAEGNMVATGATTEFINNIAGQGGALNNGNVTGNYWEPGKAYIYNTVFDSNEAVTMTFADGSVITDGAGSKTEGWSSADGGRGGAIANFDELHIKNAQFINNKAGTFGGAIYNEWAGNVTINDNSSFEGNYALNQGGAIYNNAKGDTTEDTTVTLVGVNFSGNHADISGGAIKNQSVSLTHGAIINIDNVQFNNNTAGRYNTETGEYGYGDGGAIQNTAMSGSTAVVEIKNSRFVNNGYLEIDATTALTTGNGGAIQNADGNIYILAPSGTDEGPTTFEGNIALTNGGAIHNTGGLVDIDNAIFNANGKLVTSGGDTITTQNGGAIATTYNSITSTRENALVDIKNSIFEENYASEKGGAIYNSNIVNITNSIFADNEVSETGKGGAIYGTAGSVTNVVADNSLAGFSTAGKDTIHLELGSSPANAPVLNLNASRTEVDGVLQNSILHVQEVHSDDTTNFEVAPIVNVNYGNASYTGNVNFASTVKNVNLNIYNGLANMGAEVDNTQITTNGGEIHFLDDKYFGTADKLAADGSLIAGTENRNNLILNGGTFNIQNGVVSNIAMNSIALNKTTNFKVDVDFVGQTMDNILTENITNTPNADLDFADGAHINITDMNIINEDTKVHESTILFTDVEGLSVNNIDSITEVQGSIYKYSVDKKSGSQLGFTGAADDNVYFHFANTNTPADPVTPKPIAQLGAFLLMDNIYRQSFANMDMISILTRDERETLKRYNRYSNMFDDEINTFYRDKRQEDYPSAFVRAFTNLEHVQMKRGPRVSNVTYGTLIGHESGLYELGRGWDANYAVFGAYTGAHQTYNGIGVWQNGGAVGGVFTAYKGDFWAGLTANVGGWAVEAGTDFGNEHFPLLGTGVAMKTGYNWRLFDNKFIIQPSYMMSYSFLYAYSHDNAAGVHIKQDPLHAIEFVPGIKLIANNFRNGWQPYLAVNVTWMCIEGGRFWAEAAAFDSYTIRPFVEYGIGVQKHHGERSTGFLQAMVRNGGRTGVALTGGFRYAIGEDILD